jgi:hypothetical protein
MSDVLKEIEKQVKLDKQTHESAPTPDVGSRDDGFDVLDNGKVRFIFTGTSLPCSIRNVGKNADGVLYFTPKAVETKDEKRVYYYDTNEETAIRVLSYKGHFELMEPKTLRVGIKGGTFAESERVAITVEKACEIAAEKEKESKEVFEKAKKRDKLFVDAEAVRRGRTKRRKGDSDKNEGDTED